MVFYMGLVLTPQHWGLDFQQDEDVGILLLGPFMFVLEWITEDE